MLKYLLMSVCLSLVFISSDVRQEEQQAGVGDAEKVYKQSEVDEKATVKKRVQPRGLSEGCSGVGIARLRAVVDKSGKVRDTVILRESGSKTFDEEAAKAAQRWKWMPAKKG